MKHTLPLVLLLLCAAPVHMPAQGATAPGARMETAVPEAARTRPGVRLDPEAATRAYLATVPAAERARSDAYFEGGYWIQLWSFLLGAGILLLLLAAGWSRAMRDRAERVTRRRPLQVFLYWAQFLPVATLLSLPFDVYAGFYRERRYGLATQGLGAWLRDQGKGFALSLVFGGLALMALYGVVRRFPRSWPAWGSLAAMLFLVFGILVEPVYLVPLFNRVTRLEDPRVREPILSLARANGIEVSDVYVVDASRQTTRISANVSGMLGTERITLNDNLLNRASLPEIRAVMGHEMGHYVLNHVYEMLAYLLVLVVAGFALLHGVFGWARGRWGERWGVRGIDDPAGLPLAALILSTYLFLMTPVLNTIIRCNEAEADVFGLNAAREPDGFAQIALKLREYRKLDPSPLEEALFYDHPSGRARIYAAMRWKAENPR